MTPGASIAFDDESKPTPAVDFDYSALDAAGDREQDLEVLRQEVMLGLLRMLCRPDSTPLQAGRDLHLALYFMGRGDFRNLAELADKFQVSQPRMTMLVKSFRRKFPLIAALSEAPR